MSIRSKQKLRKNFKKILSAVTDSSSQEEAIFEYLIHLPEYKNSQNILAYYSRETEVSTKNILSHSIKIGKSIYLPNSSRQVIGKYLNKTDLTKGAHNIMEPKENIEKALKTDLDLIIVPGLAFDNHGNRLGYGSGWYDRFISNIDNPPFVVALAFNEQIIAKLPNEPHDRKVDMIISQRSVLICN